jgi:hypothetical protein
MTVPLAPAEHSGGFVDSEDAEGAEEREDDEEAAGWETIHSECEY